MELAQSLLETLENARLSSLRGSIWQLNHRVDWVRHWLLKIEWKLNGNAVGREYKRGLIATIFTRFMGDICVPEESKEFSMEFAPCSVQHCCAD